MIIYDLYFFEEYVASFKNILYISRHINLKNKQIKFQKITKRIRL